MLQIYQHSLLTRKVFSRHNISAKVFFSVSSGSSSSHICLQEIFIFNSSSSSDLDHHSIWITTRHYHWIWIITRHHHYIWIITRSGSSPDIITGSGSSLDIITRSGSSLDLDPHSIWISTTGAISWFFSSQEVLQSQPFFMLVVGLASM